MLISLRPAPYGPSRSTAEVLRETPLEAAGEMVEKCEKGPMGASESLLGTAGMGFAGVVESSSPAMNLVSRPSIQDPMPAPDFVFRVPISLTGLVEGVPVKRSVRSSKLAKRAGDRNCGAFLLGLEDTSTAVQYLTLAMKV